MDKTVRSLSGRLMSALSLLGELVVLNFAMLLCCLPVITAGAAVSASCVCARKILCGEQGASVFKDFFLAFKQNFYQATALWLIQLAITLVFCGDIYYAVNIAESSFFLVFGIVGLLLSFAVSLWAYPLQSRFDNTTGRHIINAALLAVGVLPKTLLLMLLWLVPLALTLLVPEILTAFGWLWLLCGFAALQYISAKILRPALKMAEVKK